LSEGNARVLRDGACAGDMSVGTCFRCGTENPDAMRFCGRCAAPLTSGAGPPPPPPGQEHGDSIAGEGVPGELRLVTVLFADVSGFTALSERLDPEVLRELMTRCFECLVPVIERNGGTVHQFAGDEIMALFGAPRAHEDSPQRAVRCAIGLHEALPAVASKDLASLGLHVGIASGQVFAGRVEVSGRREYSIMGDAVNLAARLCEQAGAGQTLVGAEVRRRVGSMARFASAGPLRMKGKSSLVTPYLLLSEEEHVLGTKPVAAGPAVADRGIGSALIGRGNELEGLTQALDDVVAGEGRIVLVSGEAGVGKSRLIAEVRRAARADRLVWREGRALSHDDVVSYGPFLQVLEQDMAIRPRDGDEQRCEKLIGRAKELFGDQADEFVPYLATMLNVKLPTHLDPHLDALDSSSMGHQLFRTVRRYLAAAALLRPTVVVFEDVHWMDQSSLALVEHVLSLVGEVPLLVCLCGRSYPDSPTSRLRAAAGGDYLDRFLTVDLAPLAQRHSEDLLDNLIGADVLPAGLAQALLERAGGNPFFLEEQLRALVDLGWLVPQHGGWRLAHDPDALAIPDTLQDVITARIDLLEPGPRSVLRLASVMGRDFTLDVLDALAEDGIDLKRALLRLEESQLVRPRLGAAAGGYTFKHALVQEATYQSILRPLRRDLHARVARACEELHADRLPDVYSLLAYHYSRAEDWEHAQKYLFLAGNQAGRIAADAEALDHYRRALDAYGQAFGDRWDPVDRAAVERKMGEALFHMSSHEQARLHLDRAVAALGHAMPGSPAELRRAVLREVLVQIGHRLLPDRWWRRRRGTPDRAAAEHCASLSTMAWIETLGSPERLTLAHLRCLNVAETAGLDDARSRGLLFVTVLCLLLRRHWLARRYVGLAMRLARRTARPLHLAEAHLAVGYRHYALGNADAAREALGVASSASLLAGNLTDWVSATANITLVLMGQGRVNEQLVLAEDVRLRALETGNKLMNAYAEAICGMTLDQAGRCSEAVARNRRALDEMLALGNHMDGLHVASDLARALWRSGRRAEALQALLEGDRMIAANPRLRAVWNTYFWTTGADIKLAAAESRLTTQCVESAPDEVRGSSEALARARVACQEAAACIKLYRGAAVSAYRSWGTYEWLCGRPHRARWWWRKSLRAGEKLGLTYELATTHLELGKRLDDRAHLELADRLFSGMGAEFDAAQAKALRDALPAGQPATVRASSTL